MAHAEDIAVENNENVVQEEAEQVQSEEQKPQDTIVYKIEKEIISLPNCNDEELVEKTKEFIKTYFDKAKSQGVIFRRRKHFILNGVEEFTKENIANYKTPASRPVSDKIIELQMNEKVLEENMLLCKKTSNSKIMKDVFLLLHPVEEGYKVYILNLNTRAPKEENSFIYQNKLDFEETTH